MSDHSLTSFFKDCARRARNILKKTEPDDIAAHCYKEANDLGMITNDWLIHLAMRAIKDMVTIRASPKRTEFNQLRLFTDYEDIVFDLRHDDGVVQKSLGDCELSDVMQIKEQKNTNIESAVAERDLFYRASGYIEPLLHKNPEWTWRDAVRNLEARGMLPSL